MGKFLPKQKNGDPYTDRPSEIESSDEGEEGRNPQHRVPVKDYV